MKPSLKMIYKLTMAAVLLAVSPLTPAADIALAPSCLVLVPTDEEYVYLNVAYIQGVSLNSVTKYLYIMTPTLGYKGKKYQNLETAKVEVAKLIQDINNCTKPH